jgi:hypothetical protein
METNHLPITLHAIAGPEQALQCWDPEGKYHLIVQQTQACICTSLQYLCVHTRVCASVGAVRLRRDHQLLGTLIGGVARKYLHAVTCVRL